MVSPSRSSFVPGLIIVASIAMAPPARAQCQLDSFTGSAGPLGPGVVAIDGDTLAVAVADYGTNTRRIEVFVHQGASWVSQAVITRPGDPLDMLALALDGDTLALGCWPDYAGTSYFAGKVFVYRRNGSAWSLEQEVVTGPPYEPTGFGAAVALDGDTLAVGEGWSGDIVRPGKVRVFVRSGSTWTLQATLSGSDAVPGKPDDFGLSLALEGDRLVVGAPQGANPPPVGPGEVYVFERIGTAWTESARLFADDPVQGARLGVTVALDGSSLAASARSQTTGATPSVYVFAESGGAWSQQGKLVSPQVDYPYFFGTALALDGDRLLVGDPGDPSAGYAAGSVLFFRRTAGAWSLADALFGDDTDEIDAFGSSLAWDGGPLVVTGYGRDPAYLFALDDPACPRADFAASPTSGYPPLPVAFTDLSTGGVTSWSWSFGDGGTSTVPAPAHVYAATGHYNVSLVARSTFAVDREVKAGYILAQTAASATVRNGSGVNRLCLSTTSLPLIGTTWTAEVDASTHAGATATLLQGRLMAMQYAIPLGEILINVWFPPKFASFSALDAGGIGHHSIPIPLDPALDGFAFFVQGAVLGGGPELCNAIDLVAGY